MDGEESRAPDVSVSILIKIRILKPYQDGPQKLEGSFHVANNIFLSSVVK